MTTRRKTTPAAEVTFTPLTIEDAKRMVDEEIQRQIAAEWTPEKIKEKVRARLNSAFHEIVSVQLGFKIDTWGKFSWEVDHCNGRSGQTVIGQKIAEAASDAVQSCLIANGAKFTLNKEQLKALEKEFNNIVLGYQGREIISTLAKSKVQQLAQLLSGDIKGANS